MDFVLGKNKDRRALMGYISKRFLAIFYIDKECLAPKIIFNNLFGQRFKEFLP